MGDLFSSLLLVVLGLFLVSVGIEDARNREIANWKNATIALLAPLWWWSNGLMLWPDVGIQIGVAALVFAFFAGAFAIGQMGGGDVKLIGALALWLPAQPLIGMLVLMAVLGGALTLVMVAEHWTRLRGGLRALPWRQIAPALAALLAVLLLGWSGSTRIMMLFANKPIFASFALSIGLVAIGVVLIVGMRAARRGGIVPETPYGVAIAISTLIVMREPIFNQIT